MDCIYCGCASVRVVADFKSFFGVKLEVVLSRKGSVCEGEGAPGLVIDADDLPSSLLPPTVEELRLPLLLHGHGRPVQHWRNTTAR